MNLRKTLGVATLMAAVLAFETPQAIAADAMQQPLGAGSHVPVSAQGPVQGSNQKPAKIPLLASLTDRGRTLSIQIDWNDALAERRGSHRYTVTVVAGDAVAARKSQTHPVADVQSMQIRLTAQEADDIHDDGSAVTVTQQLDGKDSDTYFETNFVTVHPLSKPAYPWHGKGPQPVYWQDSYRDCSGLAVKPHADLSNCDLAGADLREAELQGVDLSRAWLSNVHLGAANLESANLSHSLLSGVALDQAWAPSSDWSHSGGQTQLLHVVNLADANLRHWQLEVKRVYRTNVTGADWTGSTIGRWDPIGMLIGYDGDERVPPRYCGDPGLPSNAPPCSRRASGS